MARLAAGDVARALNSAVDDCFAASLLDRDRDALATLMEEYFCSAPTNQEEEELELGMQSALRERYNE